MLRAQGYVSKDFILQIINDRITVWVGDDAYAVDDAGTLTTLGGIQ